MRTTSKTGLTASITRKKDHNVKIKTVQLKAIAQPAPFILKPFAGLYNPYPYGCSILCNHPSNNETKMLSKKAKNIWLADGKNILLAEEIEAVRAPFKKLNMDEKIIIENICVPQVESVPEELFRRYTDTDSRPLTPAPTLASAATRASGVRRCVTPDPYPSSQIREKTLLILDLRRSHSQEALSFYGNSSTQDPEINQDPPHSAIKNADTEYHQVTKKTLNISDAVKTKKSKSNKLDEGEHIEKYEKTIEICEPEEDEDFVKRKGKKRKKKSGDSVGCLPTFQASVDPETQVGTIGLDSHNPSVRNSLIPDTTQEPLENSGKKKDEERTVSLYTFDANSYLEKEILRQLRRELTEEIVDNELNYKKRLALEEALKTLNKNKASCEDLIAVQAELKIPPINTNLWLSLPRVFSRSTAAFELPMDSRTLTNMTPIQYVRDMVVINSAKKLLYNSIFNIYKMDVEDDINRKLSGQNLQVCLNLVMGKPMSDQQSKYFRNLIEWKEEDNYDFKTCCGIFAVCERLMAAEFCPQLPDRKTDPCCELEVADFEVLSRKLQAIKGNEKLVNILLKIKTL